MKKLIFLLVLLTFVLVACGDDEEETAEEEVIEDDDTEDVLEEDDEELDEEPVTTVQFTEEDLFYDPHIYRLVNKDHQLAEDYAPTDLVSIVNDIPTVFDNPEINQLRNIAAQALINMFDGALNDGIKLYANSGYRAYNTQSSLYNSYVNEHGQAAADRFSAPPGSSEHQTGLAMDVTADSVDRQLHQSFSNTEEGAWLRDNAHRYGFIIRYPEGKEHITGYMYEPWHLRFLGISLSTEIVESGLTYEEYLIERGFDIE